jgi:hypothetical protein
MIISIVNHTNGKVTDEELQTAIRVINRQIAEDFTPYWSLAATLRLEGRSASQPDSAQAADMRGDAVIYLWDKSDVEGALGYHFQNNRGIPFGFVFTSIAEELGEPWSITLSHEALELIGDAETNQLAIGPHPDPAQDRSVFFWFEMCDAVEAESYEIEGVKVSNFLLPLYFTGTRDNDEPGARNDYLGRAYKGQTLRSFGINPGGYVGFFDPQTGKNETYSLRADAAAKQRYETKCEVREAYRGYRYATPEAREKLQRKGTGRRAGTTSRPAMVVESLTETAETGTGAERHGTLKVVPYGKGTTGSKGTTFEKGATLKTPGKAAAKGGPAKGGAFVKGAAPAKGGAIAKGAAPAKGGAFVKGAAPAKGKALARGARSSRGGSKGRAR